MQIKELILFSNQIEAQKEFYKNTLGFSATESGTDKFSIRAGETKLSFQHTDEETHYHYCFLIPCNQLENAINWLKPRLNIIEDDAGTVIHRFESWNANAVYFYDGNSNIVEFITRHDLKNETDSPFNLENILCVNEIGMPTTNISKANRQLETELGTQFWKGDLERFGTNGDQNGLFLLPNYRNKPGWYPLNQPIHSSPFEALIVNNGKQFLVNYMDEKIDISMVQ